MPSPISSCRWRSTRSGSAAPGVADALRQRRTTNCSPRSSVARPAERSTRRCVSASSSRSGMTRSAGIVGDDLRPHLVTRAPGLPFGPDAPVGVRGDRCGSRPTRGRPPSTCRLPISPRFGQMILDDGVGRRQRACSRRPRCVRWCTNQIPGVPAQFGGDVDSRGVVGLRLRGRRRSVRSPYFGGGLLPFGVGTAPGRRWRNYWIDFEHEHRRRVLRGDHRGSTTFLNEPISGIGHRFQDVITAAVVDDVLDGAPRPGGARDLGCSTGGRGRADGSAVRRGPDADGGRARRPPRQGRLDPRASATPGRAVRRSRSTRCFRSLRRPSR